MKGELEEERGGAEGRRAHLVERRLVVLVLFVRQHQRDDALDLLPDAVAVGAESLEAGVLHDRVEQEEHGHALARGELVHPLDDHLHHLLRVRLVR